MRPSQKTLVLSGVLIALSLLWARATVLTAPNDHWSEVAEVVALDRFFPDTFGPPVPVLRLRLQNGHSVTAPLPNDFSVQPGTSVALIASRSRLGRTEYQLAEPIGVSPQRRPG